MLYQKMMLYERSEFIIFLDTLLIIFFLASTSEFLNCLLLNT